MRYAYGSSKARAESIPDLGRFSPIQSLPRQLGIRIEGLPPEDHRRRRTAPDSDRAFNAVLSICTH
ncbi:hypothetical protein PanWU01x14_344340 [Parasponia andersonii]|uniref:Uncharacterized protein n=1 Tax=Parasponia andersonii TaxID=3476 RepID=A0A2P5AD14_PARAD|nr:hypothetical protein PanWU01x14_344340 [Parasponia andersonii]